MSRIDEINSILDGLGGGATYEQVELALRDYGKREVLDVLADRSLSAGGGAALTVTGDTGEVTEVTELNLTGSTVTESAPGVAQATVSVPVLSTTVVLTDAQIKALPSTPVEILPNPAAGKSLVIVCAVLVLDRSFGAYTNPGSPDNLYLIQNDSLLEVTCYTGFSAMHAADRYVPLSPALVEQDGGYIPVQNAFYTGEGVSLSSNNSTGNFTGGHASNTLTVTLLYMEIDV